MAELTENAMTQKKWAMIDYKSVPRVHFLKSIALLKKTLDVNETIIGMDTDLSNEVHTLVIISSRET